MHDLLVVDISNYLEHDVTRSNIMMFRPLGSLTRCACSQQETYNGSEQEVVGSNPTGSSYSSKAASKIYRHQQAEAPERKYYEIIAASWSVLDDVIVTSAGKMKNMPT